MPALIGSPFTGQTSLTGLLWNAHATPAPSISAAATRKSFIRAPLSFAFDKSWDFNYYYASLMSFDDGFRDQTPGTIHLRTMAGARSRIRGRASRTGPSAA